MTITTSNGTTVAIKVLTARAEAAEAEVRRLTWEVEEAQANEGVAVAEAEAAEAEVRRLTAIDDDLSWQIHETGGLLERAQAAEAAEAEVVTLRARLAAVVDEYPHADTCGSMLTPGAGYPCSCWQADLRAALATTGEGQ